MDAKKWKERLLAAVALLIISALVIVLLVNRGNPPPWGSEMMEFAVGLDTTWSSFDYIGHMDTQVYYSSKDPRVSQIPEGKRVGFADEDAAREYGYTRAP